MQNWNNPGQSSGERRRTPPLVRWAALGLSLLGAALMANCGDPGGSSGSGSAGGCGGGECIRAVECVKECGGVVIQSGCCACPTGSFDKQDCAKDGG